MIEGVVVTGGAGFTGSALVRLLIAETETLVVTADALTYAGSLDALADADRSPRHAFERQDIRDAPAMRALLARHRPQVLFHLAAETHVDRSIGGPARFVEANVVGTFVLLEAAREHLAMLPPTERDAFRFLHVSTDEVFGSLGREGRFTEASPYRPSSPYSASKAAADHLARAWHTTYGLPVLVTNCSNTYGPYQLPGKADPGADPQRARRPGASHLRHRRQCPRLAVRRGSRPRAVGGCAEWHAGRDLRRGRRLRAQQSRHRLRHLCAARRVVPRVARPAAPGADPPRRGPPGARLALRHRRRQAPRPAGLGAAGELRERRAQDRSMVSRQPALVRGDAPPRRRGFGAPPRLGQLPIAPAGNTSAAGPSSGAQR